MDNRKRKFAEALLKNSKDAWSAACCVSDDDAERFTICREWPDDDEVRAIIRGVEGISVEDEAAGLPTKREFIKEVWERLQLCGDTDDYVKLAKLYADVRGYIQKPIEASAQQINVTNKVMVVPQLPNADIWETEARMQQKMLTTSGEEVVNEPAKLN